nr:hypothetical protein Iba_chr01eCG9620 [Ipomoea batatas]
MCEAAALTCRSIQIRRVEFAVNRRYIIGSFEVHILINLQTTVDGFYFVGGGGVERIATSDVLGKMILIHDHRLNRRDGRG